MTRNHNTELILMGALALLSVAPVRAQLPASLNTTPHSEGPSLLSLSCTSGGPSVVGVFYSITCSASGGTIPYQFSVTGTLPSGSSSTSTASAITISGKPTTAQSYDFTVTVTDHSPTAPQTASSRFSGSISNPLSLIVSPSALDFGTYQAGGITPPAKSFSVTSSAAGVSLPFGTSLDNNCAGFSTSASGSSTPANVIVSVSPSGMSTGTHICTITVTSLQTQTSTSVTASITIAAPPAPSLSVSCAPASGPANTTAAYSATCTATSGNPPYTWSLTGTVPPGVGLSGTTGSSVTVKGTPTAAGPYNYTISVSDTSIPAQTATQTFTGSVAAQPSLTLTCPSGGPGAVGIAYLAICTVSGGQAPYKWSIAGTLPAGLTLVSATATTAVISGTPGSTALGLYGYSVIVTDSSVPALTAQASYSGTITRADTSLTLVCVPGGGPALVGASYAATCTAYSGTGPYKWSTSESLPSGLSLSATTGTTVTISGAPVSAGDYRYTVTVTDTSTGATASQSYSGIVAPAQIPATLTVKCIPSPGPTAVGQAYSTNCTAVGGTPPYLWNIDGTLPAGLSLSAVDNTATIRGTPTAAAAGAYAYIVRVVDNAPRAPQTATFAFTGTLLAPLTLDCRPVAGPLAAGVAYSSTCVASGGLPPYVLSVSGDVPAGLFVSSTDTSVRISGNPTTAGPYSYAVTATDSTKPTAQTLTQSFTGVIAGPSITTPPAQTATVGVPYSLTLTADGGALPYQWAIAGTLPEGVTFDSATGMISGIPGAPGTFRFSVQLTDNNGALASAVLALAVVLPQVPAFDFSGLPASVDPAQQLSWTVTLGAAYPVPLSGTLALKFTPASGIPNDPSVLFTNGDTRIPFTIDKNATQATVPVNFQTGSAMGDIVVSVEGLSGSGQSLGSAGSHTTHVNAGPPVIKNVTLTRAAGSLTVAVVGYASSGQVTTATFQFTAASGANLQTTQLSIPVQTLFTTWYQGGQASQYGTNFTYTQTFQVQGDNSTVASVTVTLENQQGKSQAGTGR